MPFSSGTITNAAPWATLSTTIQALFNQVGSRNWTFVENIPAGTGANQSGSASFSVDVYKCAGTGTDANDAATDWYVALRIPIPDGAVTSAVHFYENYDSATKKFKRPVGTSAVTAPTGSGYWRTDTLATENAATSAQTFFSTITLNTTGFTYFVRIYKNNFTVAVRVGATDNWMFCGLGDTFIPSSLATDVLLCATDSNQLFGSAWVTREPPLTDATQTKWNYAGCNGWTPVYGSNTTNSNDFWQGNTVIVSRLLIARSVSSTETAVGYLIGSMRGLVKDILILRTGGTVNVGDTMTIGGVTYFVFALAATTTHSPAGTNAGTSGHLLLPQN